MWDAEPLRPQELHTAKAPLIIHMQRAELTTEDLVVQLELLVQEAFSTQQALE